MSEQEKQDAQLETTLEAAQPEVAQEPVAEVKTEPVKPQEEPQKEKNLRILRERAERIERERDEALNRLQQIENRNKPVEPQEDDLAINIGADDLAEGKHLNKMATKIKKLEEQIKNYQYQSTTLTAEARLKAEHPDFDKVVSKENIEILKESYPELAMTLQESSNLYTKAKSAYTLIKKLGIHTDENYDKERELVQKNAAKPKPLAAVSPQQGDSPLSRANAFANGLTPELKEQLYKEMLEARKGY
jgi:hypothetical protein